MAIPYNAKLAWDVYTTNPNWHTELAPVAIPSIELCDVTIRATKELATQIFKESGKRSVQFLRDSARLVLKVPYRAIKKPICFERNWRELERAKVNTKLTGYASVQLISVPCKSITALAALVVLVVSKDGANWLLNKSDDWTANIDGRASQLEALKEVGAKGAPDRNDFNAYKTWLYSIDPELCRKAESLTPEIASAE